jgi:ligand-binding sensor domain-containing protein
MWFGTQDGLNLYDGIRFRVFQNLPGDTASLSNNYILSLCEDEEGFIWVGTMTGGLNRFDKHNEKFCIFLHSDKKNSISENSVWTVLSDRKGNIWSGTSKGLNCLNKFTGKFTCYQHSDDDPESIITDMVVSLYKDRLGRLWVGTVEGLCLLNNSNGKFKRYKNQNEKRMPGSNLVWSISETREGKIITGTNNGVYEMDPVAGEFKLILGKPGSAKIVAWSVEARQSGKIWVGSDKGLYKITVPGYQSQIYLNDPADPQSIVDNNIWCLLPDPSGFLWAGTNNGISKAKTLPPLFNLLNGDPKSTVRLSSSKITAVLEDKQGFLWIGTDGGGLNCLSPDRKHNTVYQSGNSGLQNNNVWALAEDPEGNIWIGNYQGGLHVFKRETGRIQSFSNKAGDPYSLNNNRVLCLLCGAGGKIWIGTRGGGLSCMDPATGRFKEYLHSEKDSGSISGNTVLSLALDNKGRLWVGTYEGGLNLYVPAADKFISFRNKPGDEKSISDNNVWAILFDKKGRMWLGTQGGLNLAEKPGETLSFRYFSTRDGLKSNTIFGLAEDGEGNIWMSNFSGLTKLDMKTFEASGNPSEQQNGFFPFHSLFRSFDTDHGLQGLEFSQGAFHKGYSGTLYFGGINGLNYFTAKEVKESDFKPQIAITGLKIFNKDVTIIPGKDKKRNSFSKIIRIGKNYFLPGNITHLSQLILTFRESVLSFDFASLDFTNPRKNLYAYKMDHFDKDWNYVGTQSTATYTNLDPGEYILRVRGSNADGIWNPTETTLKITIEPPVWKQTWFIVSSVFVIILIAFLSIRRVFINQRRKAQKEKEFIELQLRTIKSQIDPHFAFNAINTIASFIYSEKPDTTYDYFTRFARLIRNILEDNDKISRPLSEEIDFVSNYLELQKMRFKDKFEYLIEVDENVPPGTTVPKMIIQTFAENAVKHGLMYLKSGGLLKIQVKSHNSQLIVVIEDNGVGREKAALLNPGTTRRGLRIIEQIIDLYGKLYHTSINQKIEDLSDSEGNSTGTRVSLTLYLPGKQILKRQKFNFKKLFRRYGE